MKGGVGSWCIRNAYAIYMRLWAVRPSAHHLKAAADGAVWIGGIKLHVVRQSRDGGSAEGAGLAESAGPRTVPSAVTVIRAARGDLLHAHPWLSHPGGRVRVLGAALARVLDQPGRKLIPGGQ